MKYQSELVDNIPNCEFWGYDEKNKYDFGRIKDFHYEIYENKTVLNYGDYPVIGFFRKKPSQLVLLEVAANIPSNFTALGEFKFEKTYKRPETINDFKMFIADFENCRDEHLNSMIIAHAEKSSKHNLINVNCGADYVDLDW